MVDSGENKTTKAFITFNEEVKKWIKKVDSTFPVSARGYAQSTFYMPLKASKKILDNIKSNKWVPHTLEKSGKVVKEETVEDTSKTPRTKILDYLSSVEGAFYEEIQKATSIQEFQLNSILTDLKVSGDVFEPRINYYQRI